MFVHTFIRRFQWTFSLHRNFKETFFNKNHFILVIKFEKLNLGKKKRIPNTCLRSINSLNFYLQAAFDDLQQVSLFQNLEISRQYFLLPTNCAKFISRHTASQHVTYVMSKARVFLSGNHRHPRFNFSAQGFQIFNFVSVLLLRQISW